MSSRSVMHTVSGVQGRKKNNNVTVIPLYLLSAMLSNSADEELCARRCCTASAEHPLPADAPLAGSVRRGSLLYAALLCSALLCAAPRHWAAGGGRLRPSQGCQRAEEEEKEVEQDVDTRGRRKRKRMRRERKKGGGGGQPSPVPVQRCQKRLPAAQDPPNRAQAHQTKAAGLWGSRGLWGGPLTTWPQKAPERSLGAASVLSGPPRGRPPLMP